MSTKFPPLLIKASAGSGKTFALSNRYLKLLLLGESPDKILASTFTRKAAAEIRSRIFERLASGASNPDKLKVELGLDSLDIKKIERALVEITKNQHKLKICTLDSFFSSILKAFELELSLLPGWRIIEGAKVAQRLQVNISKLLQAENANILQSFFKLANQGSTSLRVSPRIQWTLRELLNLYRLSDKQAWVWEAPETLALNSAEIRELSERLEKIEIPLTGSNTPYKNWQAAIDNDLQILNSGDVRDLFKLTESGLCAKIINKEATFSKKPITEETVEIYQKIINSLVPQVLASASHKTSATYELISLYESFTSNTVQQNLSFDDIKYLLYSSKISGNLEEIYYRLDSTFKHLLLDEFQDTSLREWEIIKPLTDEILSKADPESPEHTFFCVGDVKQAIYAWRGGVAEIFDSLINDYPQLEQVQSDKSYRCAPEILNFCNEFFLGLPKAALLLDWEEDRNQWLLRYSAHFAADSGKLGFIQYVKVDKDIEDSGYEETQEESFAQTETNQLFKTSAAVKKAVKIALDIRAKAPQASIGILVRRNELVKRIVFELSEVAPKEHASEEGGNPLSDAPVVKEILTVLQFIEHPGDKLACYQIAHSWLEDALTKIYGANWSDNLIRLRVDVSELGFANFISKLFKEASFSFDTWELGRVEQLIMFAERLSQIEQLSIRDFINAVQHEQVEDTKRSFIRVMTIHKSKGLEFDAVILPELDESIWKNSKASAIQVKESSLALPTKIAVNVSAEQAALVPEFSAAINMAKGEKLKEALSVFYVAITRAKHALYFVSEKKVNHKASSICYSCLLDEVFELKEGNTGVVIERGEQAWFGGSVNTTDEQCTKLIRVSTGDLDFSQERKRFFPRVLPSSLEGGGIFEISGLFSENRLRAKERGRLLHRLFEDLHWYKDKLSNSNLENILAQETRDTLLIAEIIDEFELALSLRPVQEVFSQARYRKDSKVFTEKRFSILKEEGMLTGIFDRIVCEYEQGRIVSAEIIDIKTDKLSESQDLSEKINFYLPQMQAYKEAARQLFSLSIDEIKTTLVFINNGAVETI